MGRGGVTGTDKDGRLTIGQTVWSISEQNSSYFAPSQASFMINFRVADLRGLLANLREEG
jgi:hypothetical protein